MIVKGVDVLVIAAIDGTTLSNTLEYANAAGINVISYDRLIKNSLYVSYYATFDNFKVGVLQAKSLVNGMENAVKALTTSNCLAPYCFGMRARTKSL
ncbi:MAG: putative multiple sugar transport system substrate-binding protein [Marinomonas primoryensis]|jgi:putative multiple sugar transport system substrate-binding protein